MVTDGQTNFLYLSDKIEDRKLFSQDLVRLLDKNQVAHAFLPSTKDIWAVDYMPIQVGREKFIRFTYQPDYLNFKKYQATITDVDKVCEEIELEVTKSKIVLDGGNIIKGKDWVILTDKIFKENIGYKPTELVAELESLLEVRVIIIPREPGDYTGHADGILRYYDEDTVLVNRYPSFYATDFRISLMSALHNAGLKSIEVPYEPANRSKNDAQGLYINYLQMEKILIMPTFDLPVDDRNVYIFEQLFPAFSIQTIDCSDISKDGGVLNCISWNILGNM